MSTKPPPRDSLAEVDELGRFKRTAAGFREIISKQNLQFQPAYGRYHLYVSMACPWANRCVAILNLKGLTDCIGVTVVHPTWQRSRPNDPIDLHYGWVFFDSEKSAPLSNPEGMGQLSPSGCEPDPINGANFIRDLYELSKDQIGKYSVPVLWDKKNKCIVNNESSEIMRMLSSEFNEWANG